MSDNERLQKRKTTVKVVWSILFLISAIVTIIVVSLAISDKEVIYYEYLEEYSYYMKDKYIVLLYLFGTWDIFCIAFWLVSLIGVKFSTYSYKEHKIHIYLGFIHAYLLLDGKIVDKESASLFGFHPLECDLDGEKIILKVNAFLFNSYTLRIGNKVLH